jgi:modulator of FtsH protease
LQNWATFASLAGGAAAALTGLLFVIALLISIVLSIPDQAHWVLGLECVALVSLAGAVLLTLERRANAGSGARATSTQAVASLLDVVAPNLVTAVALALAGVLLGFAVHAGLYVLVLPVLVAIVGGVVSAWLALTKITGYRRVPGRPTAGARQRTAAIAPEVP